ncbi:MAG: HTH-type transcriptional repressor FabR [Pseudomonadota bacterium]
MNNPPELPVLAAERLARGPQGRRAVISRDELIAAAMSLLGPTRSVSTLSLREVARAAGIAPNSFYRHFRDIDDLAIALIELAGSSLRRIFSEARQRISAERSVVRTSLEVFMEQLNAEAGYLDLLLREGKVGSEAFKLAVEKQLVFFEEELMTDLLRLEALNGHKLHRADLVARAITRLVFVMGASAAHQGAEAQRETLEQTALMLKMIITGSRSLASMADQEDAAAH